MPTSITSYSVKEEITNAISHGLGAILSCMALYLLLNQPASPFTTGNEVIKLISYSIYGASLLLLFLASTIYHALVNEKAKSLFKLLDHCAIYLLIAGTYTPLLLITLAGPLGYSLIVLIWTIAIAGISFKIKFGSRFKKISLATYLGMGFISFAILGELYQALPYEAIELLALGGLIYCLGVIFYVKKHIAYTHAIWHFFVLGGAICHFLMIYWYVK
jgi:hemolysin III